MSPIPPLQEEAVQLAESTASGFKLKADHNKTESLICFGVVVVFSLASPLFVTLGEGVFWGKILPSILSLSVAASTAWLQLRKPQIYGQSTEIANDGLRTASTSTNSASPSSTPRSKIGHACWRKPLDLSHGTPISVGCPSYLPQMLLVLPVTRPP